MENNKEYMDALDRARVEIVSARQTGDKHTAEALEQVFPELKENDDEKTAREIKEFIYWAVSRGSVTDEDRSKINTWVTWLESQHGSEPEDESWPNLSNCKHDCTTCNAKCFYRKHKREDDIPSNNKWTEHDKKQIRIICDYLAATSKNGYTSGYYTPDLVHWLQNLKPRSKTELEKELLAKFTWTDEDELQYQCAYDWLRSFAKRALTKEAHDEAIAASEWVKGIKDRLQNK